MRQWESQIEQALQEFVTLKNAEKQKLRILRRAEQGLDFRLRFSARETWFQARELAHAKNRQIVGMIEFRMRADKVQRDA